jgi:phospholipid N-methyltransferase
MNATTFPAPEYTATYSPDDNKLRLYAVQRLPQEIYDRVRKAGFAWAPKQQLFVAPAWTPEREDLLLELAGDVGDEDMSLAERQEERAERFEGYKDRRAVEAERAHEHVSKIADGIPLGQPILVGHHSERRARKDAERIRSGFEKAARLWRTSEYWEGRAKGALRLAKYKELPQVRYRRIKGLETDKRRQEKDLQTSKAFEAMWHGVTSREAAMKVANYDHTDFGTWSDLDQEKTTWEEAQTKALASHERRQARALRWLEHLRNRLAYERAMLGEQGGLVTDQHELKVGGRVLVGGTWATIVRINVGIGGKVESVSTNARNYLRVASVEQIKGYQEPEEGAAEKVKASKKLPPLVNYPGEGFRHMTTAEWNRVMRHTSGFYRVARISASLEHAAHRRREAPKEGGSYWNQVGVYLTDMKRTDPPPLASATPKPELPLEREHVCKVCGLPVSDKVHGGFGPCSPPPVKPRKPSPADALEARLKAGVEVVAVPGLYETPKDVAEHMVNLANILPGHRVLEPSAGLGALVRPIGADRRLNIELAMIEIVPQLAKRLEKEFPRAVVLCADFLDPSLQLGSFDRILMNPPFEKGIDVRHVQKARALLAPGGILVGICAGGPRQKEALEKHAVSWEPLPEGTFKQAGTMVSAVLFTMRGSS